MPERAPSRGRLLVWGSPTMCLVHSPCFSWCWAGCGRLGEVFGMGGQKRGCTGVWACPPSSVGTQDPHGVQGRGVGRGWEGSSCIRTGARAHPKCLHAASTPLADAYLWGERMTLHVTRGCPLCLESRRRRWAEVWSRHRVALRQG